MKRLVMIIALVGGAGLAEAEPPQTHEIIYTRPSGFWTSNRPAENGSYRYRLLGIGVVIAAIMGLTMKRLIKRANSVPRMTIKKIPPLPRKPYADGPPVGDRGDTVAVKDKDGDAGGSGGGAEGKGGDPEPPVEGGGV